MNRCGRGWQAALLALLLTLCAGRALATAEDMAVLDADRSGLSTHWGGVRLRLHLSVPLAYRVAFEADPMRLVVEFEAPVTASGDLARLRGAQLQPAMGARSQVVLDLKHPLKLGDAVFEPEAESAADGEAGEAGGTLTLWLSRTDARGFADEVAASPALAAPPLIAGSKGHSGLVVMIDPDHGGLDPGAEYAGIREADVVLATAERLKSALEARGVTVAMTREDDHYVSLTERLALTRSAGAGLFISLHADALAEGSATGASVHSLPAEDGASGNRFLLDRLGEQAVGDKVSDAASRALMGLIRPVTVREGATLADDLITEMGKTGVPLYKTPHKLSNFVVLRGADVPSVLVELGYLSNDADRARLTDPDWRQMAAEALARGVADWAHGPRESTR